MDFLSKILAAKREEVAETKRRCPLEGLVARLERRDAARGFCRALSKPGVRVIAEIKRASPSKGDLRLDLDPAALAHMYESGGAACLSVLTEPAFFKGSIADFSAARDAVSLPVLRKDFILEPYQVFETAAAGADAMLLILRCVTESEASELLRLALALGLDVLVECYDAADARRIPVIFAGIPSETLREHVAVGINNRDLSTFQTEVSHAAEVAKGLPDGLTVVALSGIAGRRDVQTLQTLGINRFLVGEALVRSVDATATLREWREPLAPGVKICGIRYPETAVYCVNRGAGALGAVFYPPSPRYVSPAVARTLFDGIPESVARVGVFVNQPVDAVLDTARTARLTTVQLHGAESPAAMRAVADAGFRVVKAVKSAGEAATLPSFVGPLLECSRGTLPGGNGASWNWAEAKTLAAHRPIAIAGGLTPENLVNASEASGAVALDVSSGAESSPGVKDCVKIASLLARSAGVQTGRFWL